MDSIPVGTVVRFKWPREAGDMTGTVVAIRGDMLLIRLAGDRWRNAPPIPAKRNEVEPAE